LECRGLCSMESLWMLMVRLQKAMGMVHGSPGKEEALEMLTKDFDKAVVQ